MKSFVFALFVFVQLFSFQIHGQKCIDDTFEVMINNSNPDVTDISYSDKNRNKFRISPKLASSVPQDKLISLEFVSIPKKDSIERTLFKTEELDTLKRGLVVCYVHIPSGKIVSTSFLLQNYVDINKLKKLKAEIEKNLHFNVRVSGKLEKEGYWRQAFPIFVSNRKKRE